MQCFGLEGCPQPRWGHLIWRSKDRGGQYGPLSDISIGERPPKRICR